MNKTTVIQEIKKQISSDLSLSHYSQDLIKFKQDLLTHFEKMDFPSSKQENFNYSEIKESNIWSFKFIQYMDVSGQQKLLPHIFNGVFKYHLTFLDGMLRKDLSKVPSSLQLKTLSTKEELESNFAHVISQNNYFLTLNLLLTSPYYQLIIPKGQILSDTIALFFINTKSSISQMTAPHLSIEAQENSYSNFFSVFMAEDNQSISYVNNHFLNLSMQEKAVIDYTKLQIEASETTHISNLNARLRKSAIFNSQILTLGASLVRDEQHLFLMDQNARVNLYGLYDLDGHKQSDHFIDVDHQHSETYSHQLFKGVLKDTSHGIFTGKVTLQEKATGSVSTQLNKNLIINPAAKVNTRPQLMINTDDVKCTHGATIGQLDQEQLFYLKSRGMDDEQARKMLYHAFSREIIEAMGCSKIKQILNDFFIHYPKYNMVLLKDDKRCQHGILNYT